MMKYGLQLCVFMISYNQEDFIIEALESVLNQKTNFTYRVILSDDCSTDNTKEIINNFLNGHPKKGMVEFISQPKNLGWMPNFIFTLQKCKDSGAKYIAMCEGDDFWTNKDKLQKQVDLLEANPNIVLSCHKYEELYNDGSKKNCPYFRKDFFKGSPTFKFSQKDFEEFMRIQTMTIVFRSNALDLEQRHKYDYYCDTHIKHHILDYGVGIYSSDNDAVYRIHGNNVFMSQDQTKKMKFTYDVYKDLIVKNNSTNYKNLLNISMCQRVENELKNKKFNFIDPYYQHLLIQQFKDVNSIPLFIKNQIKGILNIF